MNKFLGQFFAPSMSRAAMDGFVFRVASQVLVGYNGGNWESYKFGELYVLRLPINGETVILLNPFSDESFTMDHHTACLTFTFLVVNWFWEYYEGNLDDRTLEYFENYVHALKNMVYDNRAKDIDTNSFYKMTD